MIVRPEAMRFVEGPAGADNVLTGRVFNEYALGSRVQYQVHVADKTFLVELPRTAASPVQGDIVSIGWDARDAIVVEA